MYTESFELYYIHHRNMVYKNTALTNIKTINHNI